MKTLGVILSGGVGKRFNDNLPKQYHYVNGKMVIEYVVDALKRSNVDDIVVACSNKEFCDMITETYQIPAILGGNERNQTVGNVLRYARSQNETYDKILFFDSARPNIQSEYINECISLLDKYDCVITAQKITDSLGQINNLEIDRSNYFLIQTPECFRMKVLDNFDEYSNKTAIVQQLDKSCTIYNNFNCPHNIKITYSGDLETASTLLKNKIGNVGVILAAGMGQRFGSLVHKQYLKLNGKEMLSYAIERMSKCKNIQKIFLVVDKEEFECHYIENKYKVECICGGNTRNISIKNALNYIKKNYICDKILFHDATRPLIKTEYYEQCIDELEDNDCVVSYQEITDSICDENNKFYNRDNFKLIQTPEVFRFDELFKIFDENSQEKTLVGQLKNPKIHFKKSDKFGFKITYPNDLFLAEQLDKINYYEMSKNHNKNYDFSGKKFLIFGGSGGVGSALIKKLTDKFTDIEIKAPSSREINLKNVTAEQIKDYCGEFSPDYIISTAAVSFNDDDGIVNKFDDVFDVNLKSNLVILDYLKTLNKPVKFVVISSSSSTKGRENITDYSASKCALNSVIESLASRLAKSGVLINAVVPEKINTPMIQKIHKTNICTRELLDVDDVIEAIFYLWSSDEAGQLIHLRKGL